MLNYLRSDLYRLLKTHSLATMFLLIFGICLILPLGGTVACLLTHQDRSGWSMGESFLQMAGNMGFSAYFLIIVTSFCPIALIAADAKNAVFKTQLCGARSRRDYIASKLTLGALFSIIMPAFMLLCMAVLPLPFHISYATVPPLFDVIAWWAAAALYCFAFCALSTFVSLLIRNETLIWCFCAIVLFGALDNLIAMPIGYLGSLVPAFSGIAQTIISCLPATQASIIGFTGDLIALNAPGVIHLVLVGCGWAAFGIAASLLAMRRKSV